MGRLLIRGEYRLLEAILEICQVEKKHGAVEFFEQRAIWGWKFQNTTLTLFIRSQPKFRSTSANTMDCLLPFLASRQVLKLSKVRETLKFQHRSQ